MSTFQFKLGRHSPIRFGALRFNEVTELPTPCCLLYTRKGSVPHLTMDNFERVVKKPHALLINLQTTYDLEETVQKFGKSLVELSGFPATTPSVVTIHDSLAEIVTQQNDKHGVAIWQPSGKVKIDPSKYSQILTTFKPSVFQALCDGNTTKSSSKKRLTHAVKRSISYLEETIKDENLRKFPHLASIQGGFDPQFRTFSLEGTLELQESVSGFILDGFHSNGETASALKIDDIEGFLVTILRALPADKARFMLGAFRPGLIKQLVKLGIDCFDSSYACLCTDKGRALVFDWNNIDHDTQETDEYMQMDLTVYRDDMSLILEGCECYTCVQGFSRAYINHLLVTKELLAYVLLQLHNLHHFLKFFETLQEQQSSLKETK